MKTNFINVPDSDLRGPETENDDFAEEVRKDVESHQKQADEGEIPPYIAS